MDDLRAHLDARAGVERTYYASHPDVLIRRARDEIERLRAERAEAIDQRNAADLVLAIVIEQSTRHSVEREAMLAEVERLRREVLQAGGAAS